MAEYYQYACKYIQREVTLCLLITVYIAWLYFACTNRYAIDLLVPFGGGFNLPSITSCTMGMILITLLCCATSVAEKVTNSMIDKGLGMMNLIGKQSLWIFLYHRLFLDYILIPYVGMSIGVAKTIVYFMVMVGGSVLLNFSWQKIKKSFSE